MVIFKIKNFSLKNKIPLHSKKLKDSNKMELEFRKC